MRSARLLISLLLALVLLGTTVPMAGAQDRPSYAGAGLPKVTIQMDGKTMDFTGYLLDSRTVVPLRAIFETLGATIEWDGVKYEVTATKGPRVIKLQVGNMTATKDGVPVQLAMPPVLIDSRTFVPLRFVAEALDTQVGWIQETKTATISSGSECSIPPYQEHTGVISSVGETWGKCGSPHVITGEFRVEGVSNPILTLEEGATVHFAAGARLIVGERQPGGLRVYGTANLPVTLTASSSGPQAGFWEGILFGSQTLQNDTSMEYATIDYAGGVGQGAIVVAAPDDKPVEVLLKNVTIKNSLYAGINLQGMARLKAGSEKLTITGTVASSEGEGGFPIIAPAYGTHNLPAGTYRPNAVSAVNVNAGSTANDKIASNVTWKNIGVPYAISQTLWVEGPTTPTLTIEPGVVSLWAPGTALIVGQWAPGTLVAESKGLTRADLDRGLKLASLAATAKECADCALNKAIVFGPWSQSPTGGEWEGIQVRENAGDRSKLVGTVVAYGGSEDYELGGVTVGTESGAKTKLLLANSMIYGADGYGLWLNNTGSLLPGSTGNVITKSGAPVIARLDNVNTLLSDNDFQGNETDAVFLDGSSELTVKSTWRALNVPYRTNVQIWVGVENNSTLTLEPGVTIEFAAGTTLNVGRYGGDLIAKGTKDKPITFTGIAKRPGYWEGLSVEESVGNIAVEYAVIEYANNGVWIHTDIGRFIENSIIRNNKGYGIYSEAELTTSHLEGNTFQNNGEGDEVEIYGDEEYEDEEEYEYEEDYE